MRSPSESVSIPRLHELFKCVPEEGLFWRVLRGKGRPGARAGFYNKRLKQRCVTVDGRCYLEQRLMWAMVNTEWPPTALWHKNRDPTDNRISNLTLKPSEHRNLLNRRKSDVPGVFWREGRQRWLVVFKRHGKTFSRWYEHRETAEAAARRVS